MVINGSSFRVNVDIAEGDRPPTCVGVTTKGNKGTLTDPTTGFPRVFAACTKVALLILP
jgi:hypothetical protein